MKDIDKITKELEQGVRDVFTSERYIEYLDFCSKFYDYSANNIILILIQKPDASFVAGYKAWQTKFKRQVKKGEKAITILAPSPRKITKIVKKEDGTEEEREIKFMTYRPIPVFDISQTEGEDVPSDYIKKLDGTVEDFADLCQKLRKVSPVDIVFEDIDGGANGYYQQIEKKIVIKKDMSEEQTIKTMIHEIAHARIHDLQNGEEKDADRRTKEVQAESVAYTVCRMIGIKSDDYSFGYIASWSKDREVKELSSSIEIIRKTAHDICEELRSA